METPIDLSVPFIIGVSGRMDFPPDDEKRLAERFREVVRWIQGKDTHKVLGRGLGLKFSPIWVLTSLAPGVDQLVALEALKQGLVVKSPLPFPAEVYRGASTFERMFRPKEGESNEDAEARKQELETANRSRLDHYDSVLKTVGRENTFPVFRPCDLGLTASEREERFMSDRDDGLQRNLRYRAAGEYVSSYCHLLLAFTDGAKGKLPELPQPTPQDYPPEAQSGTDWIMASHLHGRQPHTLPIQAPLSSADNGAVIRIWTRRNAKGPETADRVGEIDFFVPDDLPELNHECLTARQVESSRLHFLAGSMEEGNEKIARESAWSLDPDAALNREFPLDGDLSQNLSDFRRSLAPITTLRRVVADEQRALDRVSKTHRYRLLIFAAIVSGLLLLASGSAWKGIAEKAGQANNVSQTLLSVDHWFYATTAAALITVIVGTIWHWFLVRRHVFEHQHTFRAVAEALRIQLAWIAAGTGASVASHYLQRCRMRVAWVRSAVSFLAIPYEQGRERFETLPLKEQSTLLRAVHRKWVAGQATWFDKKTQIFERNRFRLSALIKTLLFAGVTLTISGICLGYGWVSESQLTAVRTIWPWWSGSLGFLAIGIVFANWLSDGTRLKKEREANAKSNTPPRKWWVSRCRFRAAWRGHVFERTWFWALCGIIGGGIILVLIPVFSQLLASLMVLGLLAGLPLLWSFLHSRSAKQQDPQGPPWFYGPHALAFSHAWAIVGTFLAAILYLQNQVGQGDPFSTGQWIVFFRTILFTIAALLGARIGYAFLAENAGRYGMMQEVFAGAEKRIEEDLDHLDALIEEGKDVEARKKRDRIRERLVALGEEAIHENTDWLQMHRDKPLAPMFPNV
ncbi:MAG: hypothetical protein AAF357_00525 [Verrucomicrobiota bacterium]